MDHNSNSRIRKARKLQRSDERTSFSAREGTPIDGPAYSDNLYGIAYQKTYKDGFYYGDLYSDESATLPQCFADDLDC